MTTAHLFTNRTIELASMCGIDRGDTAVILALWSAGVPWKEIEQQLDAVNAYLMTFDQSAHTPHHDKLSEAITDVQALIDKNRRHYGERSRFINVLSQLKHFQMAKDQGLLNRRSAL